MKFHRRIYVFFICVIVSILFFSIENNVFAEESHEIKEMMESVRFLQKELSRTQDILAIQKLMGRYETIHNPTDMYKTYMLFAERPDTRFNISGSSVTGYDNIKKQFFEMTEQANVRGVKGTMYEHPLSTPIIEVAGDGQTAKGTFVSFGHETMGGGADKLTAMWCHGKYAIDFIKINGEWKIWHLQWIRIFRSSFDTSWVDQPIEESYGNFYVNGKIIEKDGIYFKPYHTGKIFESIPAAPKPYETWTDEEEGWWKLETLEP